MDLVERLRALIGAEGSRRTFSAAKARLYRGTVSALHDLGDNEAAFRVSERARSRAFLDMLGERRIVLGDKNAQARLGPAREAMLGALPPLDLGFAGPGDGLCRRLPLADSGRLPDPDPRKGWMSLVTVNPAGVADVRKVLGKDEALVSFFHDGRRLLVFVIDRRGLHVAASELDEETLRRHVVSLLRALKKPNRPERLVKKKAGRLYTETLKPAIGFIGSKKLVVVPWGPLHYVPFSVLHDGERYMIDRFEALSIAPSASTLVMIRAAGRRRSGEVLALGNPVTDMQPLPAALEEVKVIGKTFDKATVRVGSRASKDLFMKRASGARLIHVASHGVFLPERPMNSYLALSGQPPTEGRLSAEEILQLDLSQTEMIVLSACDTGRSEIAAGDEVIGLTRAFLHAGTRTLVASLWPLSDKSASSMVRKFYASYSKGLSPERSLNEALRLVKSEPEFSHPFFWAPFELFGG